MRCSPAAASSVGAGMTGAGPGLREGAWERGSGKGLEKETSWKGVCRWEGALVPGEGAPGAATPGFRRAGDLCVAVWTEGWRPDWG